MTNILQILDLYDDIRISALSSGQYEGSKIRHNSHDSNDSSFIAITIQIPKLANVKLRYENGIINYNGFIITMDMLKQRLIEIRENLQFLEEVS